MSDTTPTPRGRSRRARTVSVVLGAVATVVAALALAACGAGDKGGSGTTSQGKASSEHKLIVGTMGFPCGLNDFARQMCVGFEAAKKQLPEGYELEVRTGINFDDNTAYNNIIQTELQKNPAGLLVFPGGSAAQVPILKQACAKGIKIIIMDIAVEGLGECQDGFITSDNLKLGVSIGRWLIDHPPSSKEIGIVTLQPGQYKPNDDRVKGFTETVEAAGYRVVATVVTDLSLDKTRTQVTNMLSAHPNIGTIMSANDQMGDGTAQAVKDPNITQLSIDGSISSVKRILKGGLAADASEAPTFLTEQAVLNMVKLLQGDKIPKLIIEPSEIVDKTNAADYIARGGTRG